MKIESTKSVMKKSKKPAAKKKKRLSKISTDEFFNQDFEDDINDDSNNGNNSDNNNVNNDGGSIDENADPAQYKKSLMKLNQIYPEFYAYLLENDKRLLELNVSDDDNDLSDDDNEETNKIHIHSICHIFVTIDIESSLFEIERGKYIFYQRC